MNEMMKVMSELFCGLGEMFIFKLVDFVKWGWKINNGFYDLFSDFVELDVD